jgi:hypothetical protein
MEKADQREKFHSIRTTVMRTRQTSFQISHTSLRIQIRRIHVINSLRKLFNMIFHLPTGVLSIDSPILAAK